MKALKHTVYRTTTARMKTPHALYGDSEILSIIRILNHLQLSREFEQRLKDKVFFTITGIMYHFHNLKGVKHVVSLIICNMASRTFSACEPCIYACIVVMIVFV